jgi:chromosome partitioning protein
VEVDWVVLRNRLSTLEARNRKRVGAALDELSKRVGFRVLGGLSERVIFREFFPRGLTLLDREALEDFSLSHVGARSELRALVAGLNLPGWDAGKLA